MISSPFYAVTRRALLAFTTLTFGLATGCTYIETHGGEQRIRLGGIFGPGLAEAALMRLHHLERQQDVVARGAPGHQRGQSRYLSSVPR